MRFCINREVLLGALRAVAGVVERRNSQGSPILSHILIQIFEDKISLTTTDQEVELIAIAPLLEQTSPFQIAVSFRKLMDLCRAMPENENIIFTKDPEANKVTIRANKSRFTLSTLPAEEFPNLNLPACEFQFEVAKKTLRKLIDSVSFAMAEQDVRYYLNGMLLEVKQGELYAVAADGHRLALNSTPLTMSNNKTLRIIVPRKGILELQRILDDEDYPITLIIGANHLRVQTSDVTLTTKLLEGRFPEYDRIIPMSGDKVVMGHREHFKEAFVRASALFSDKFRGIRLQLAPSRLKILATNTEQDEAEEDLEVNYQGSELEIGFNVKYLIDFLNVIQTEVVRFTFSDANSSARVEGVGAESGIYIIMPMRI